LSRLKGPPAPVSTTSQSKLAGIATLFTEILHLAPAEAQEQAQLAVAALGELHRLVGSGGIAQACHDRAAMLQVRWG
jgi:hypothetical protein